LEEARQYRRRAAHYSSRIRTIRGLHGTDIDISYDFASRGVRDNEAHNTRGTTLRKARKRRAETRAKLLMEKSTALEKKAEEIRQQHLRTVRSFGDPTIIYLPKDIALHYLSLCASQAATDKKGNQKRDLVADGGRFTEAVFHDYSVSGEVATTVLQAYLPKNLADLEFERIAEFREEFAAQRLAYQIEIQSMVEKATKVASEGELEALKDSIVELAKQNVDDTRSTYRRAHQEMVIKAVGVSLTPPAIATAIGSALGIGIFGPAGIVAALSILGAKLLLDRDKANTERAKSPWSYVLDSARLA
jgi:hypothetical protein